MTCNLSRSCIALLVPSVLAAILALGSAVPVTAAIANRDFLWEGEPVWIRVCWENSTAASSTRRNWVRRAVESTWARYARVNFVGWNACTANSNIRILIDNSGGSQVPPFWQDGKLRSGRYIDGNTNNVILNLDPGGWCRNSNGNRSRCIRAVAVHEFGHVLGLWHEEERDDYAPAGDRNRNGVDDASERACKKQDFGTNNYAPQKYGAYDVNSVMSYCGQPDDQPGTWKTVLSAGDIAAVQRAYGRRIAGSLVSPRADCISSHADGPDLEPVFLWDCDEALDDQEWAYDDSHLYLGSSRCLENEYWSNSPGDATLLYSCGSYPTQEWVFENTEILGWGGLCLDLEGGNTTNWTNIQMWRCGADNGVNQKWSITETGKIKFGNLSSNKCVSAYNGNVFIYDCGYDYYQEFVFLPGGMIRPKHWSGSKCFDVHGWWDSDYLAGEGLPRNGLNVQIFDCHDRQDNQKWNLSGVVKHRFTDLCLDRRGNSHRNGTAIQISTCNSSTAQQWDYYFAGR